MSESNPLEFADYAIGFLKYGAIGVSMACLILAFWTNFNLTRRAQHLQPDALKGLIDYGKWTMKFSVLCLLIAAAVELASHFELPTALVVDVSPTDLEADAKRVHLSRIDKPLRLRFAGGDVSLLNGAGRIMVTRGSTLYVNLDAMWSALKATDDIAYGERERANGNGNTVDPHDVRRATVGEIEPEHQERAQLRVLAARQ